MAGMVCDTKTVEWIEFNFIKKILKFIYNFRLVCVIYEKNFANQPLFFRFKQLNALKN